MKIITKIRLILYVSAIILVSGCAAHQPIPDNYQGPLSNIKDSITGVSNTRVHIFQLKKVDGRQVQTSSAATSEKSFGAGKNIYPAIQQRQVPAQTSTLEIEGLTYVAMPILALGGNMHKISGKIEVNLMPDQSYTVKGVLSETYSAVWLEDEAGAIISQKLEEGVKP